MKLENTEMYVGAVYRLREDASIPLPLSQLRDYFDFSPISVHEMVQKLEVEGLVQYTPYRGVTLTPEGETIAAAMVRRHRIWERFLTDQLGIPVEQVHDLADQLEHAAPELVTDRLAEMMGAPETCPHGGVIPPAHREKVGAK